MDSINNIKTKLIMTLLVRDEEDIVRYNIDFHLSKGVDFIIATDNGSTDSTRDILREYEERGVLHLIDEPTHNHNQAQWNNRMAQIAHDQYDADIIFHCDADEFWYPRSGNLKDEILKRKEDILVVDVVNVLLQDKRGDEAFPEDTKFAVFNPIIPKDYEEETKQKNLFYFKYPPKVMFTVMKKLLLVTQGNHSVANMDETITIDKAHDILIYHYPIRSKEQFIKKVIRSGSAYEKNKLLDKGMGFHLRRWYDRYKEGFLDEEYKNLILHEDEVAQLILEGFIEEIDFHSFILGHEDKKSRWRFFNRKFEYEDMFMDFNWPWAGHKNFAYDLIRNIKPQTIVELGTHKGTSFFSFCQAVKDAYYDASLYAIDTWRGDEHAGFYNDNVFNEVRGIKEKYYDSLKIKFLRKTFDEAIGQFENNTIDLLHIDGLHTYTAVKNDFEKWFPKVKNDGIIMLHDIFISRDDFGVYKLWEDLKREYKTIEFHHSYGLGILFKDDARYQTLTGR
ncbi:MAG: class I SAM-dependent methyltransferase, partial [Smithella sp.]|nr:class I SAM-dependent methyltransferase [Smithella sp.]